VKSYGVTPNENETQVTSANISPNQAADYIRMMEHTRRIESSGDERGFAASRFVRSIKDRFKAGQAGDGQRDKCERVAVAKLGQRRSRWWRDGICSHGSWCVR
jgi:hypothetical protein